MADLNPPTESPPSDYWERARLQDVKIMIVQSQRADEALANAEVIRREDAMFRTLMSNPHLTIATHKVIGTFPDRVLDPLQHELWFHVQIELFGCGQLPPVKFPNYRCEELGWKTRLVPLPDGSRFN